MTSQSQSGYTISQMRRSARLRRAIEHDIPLGVGYDGRGWAVVAQYPDRGVTIRRCVSEYSARLALTDIGAARDAGLI